MGAAIIAAVGMILGTGCSDDTIPIGYKPEPTSISPLFPWLGYTGKSGYGYFFATAQSHGPNPARYHVGGNIYTTPFHTATVNGGTMTAGDVTVNFESDSQYFSISRPTFGAVSTWGLAGNPANGVPAFTDQMYVPAEISLISPAPGSVISKASPVTVQWNPDPQNDTVVIFFEYDMTTSQFVDSTSPSIQYGRYYIVPDNGSHTISITALAPFPDNSYMNMYVARGNGKTTGTPTREFFIYGSTISSGLFKVTP